jgi:hypothetical protein
MSLDSKISVLTEADSKEASKVDALMREGKIEAGDRWSNAMKASSDDHNALEQVEAALRNCDYLAKRQRGICENQVVTSRPPDCASLSAIQRHDHVPCTPRLPGGAQRAPPPMDETAVSACLSSRMEQLAKDNAGRAQPFTDWIAQTIGARAAAALRAKQIAAARADPAMVLHANSAYLCALLAHKAEKAAEIKKEKTYAARYGQVIDMEGIHDDQERIKADDEEIEKVKADLSRAKPLPCKDASVAAGAACIRAYLDAHGANVQTDVT